MNKDRAYLWSVQVVAELVRQAGGTVTIPKEALEAGALPQLDVRAEGETLVITVNGHPSTPPAQAVKDKLTEALAELAELPEDEGTEESIAHAAQDVANALKHMRTVISRNAQKVRE